MRLSRHARNRLRWLRAGGLEIDEHEPIGALSVGEIVGQDLKGNSRIVVSTGGGQLMVVVDAEGEVVVTIWREV